MIRILLALMIWSACLVNAQAVDYHSLAGEVLKEMNLARTSPDRYANAIRQFRRQYSDGSFTLPGSRTRIMTQEGVAAVDEAISFLSRQKRVPPLAGSKGLSRAAMDLVKDQRVSGATGHSGGSSGHMQQRIERHGTWRGRIGENISYGPDSARMVVMGLIIDDGVPDRGHRRNIFDRSFTTAGVACGKHPRLRNMCVIDFSGRYSDK